MPKLFLTAEWRQLVMLNYPIDLEVLAPHVPKHTELDLWQGQAYVSLVGFRFLNTRVKGLTIPFHRNFDEINLRFYVKRTGPEGIRRGVVFVREVVPKLAIATIARWVYNEPYVARKTQSVLENRPETQQGNALYRWRDQGQWLEIGATYQGQATTPEPGSEAEFIAEHYWGYSAQRNGSTIEYRVEHPPWRVWSAIDHVQAGNFASFYGHEFTAALDQPSSVFIAEGSEVKVRSGERLA